jgi:hypothetical protein
MPWPRPATPEPGGGGAAAPCAAEPAAAAAAAAAAARRSAFCAAAFPPLFASFAERLADVLHAGGPVAARRPHFTGAPAAYAPPARRLVAIGDAHGDLHAMAAAFRAAGLVDAAGRWAGGDAICVQVGDILDRGDDELKAFYWLERVAAEAAAAGGALHVLLGNHETMTAAGQFRYATPGAYVEFHGWAQRHALEAALKARCGWREAGGAAGLRAALALRRADGRAARRAAFAPGGPLARRFLAPCPVVLRVGSTLFAHGGLLPQHAALGAARINAEAAAWLRGMPASSAAAGDGSSAFAPPRKPEFLFGRNAVVWARDYSAEDPARCDCVALSDALAAAGAARMVMGHTIQEAGVNSACGGRALRVDVGYAAGCGGSEPEALEILGDGAAVRRLRAGRPPARVAEGAGGAAPAPAAAAAAAATPVPAA